MAFSIYSWLTRLPDRIIGTRYSPSPSVALSSDATSSYFPDRPIRPLPKRRLRSRLSSGVAESILYPPVPASSTPLFIFPYNRSLEPSGDKQYLNRRRGDAQSSGRGVSYAYGHAADEVLDDLDSEDEDDGAGIVQRYQGLRDAVPSSIRHSNAGTGSQIKMPPMVPSKPPPPRSNTSSADGYDSFENTNNKKKRKIPTSGSANNHHSHLSADMANMGISPGHDSRPTSPDELGNGTGQYYGTGSSVTSSSVSGNGISGAGRGRYGRIPGRSISGKSPLGVSTDGSNAWATGGRATRTRRDWTPNAALNNKAEGTTRNVDQGIISAAIASAAEKGLAPPPKGQENVSLLQQSGSKQSTPTKTQFTFTCESDTTKGMIWPLQSYSSPAASKSSTSFRPPIPPSTTPSQGHRRVATQGTQTSPSMGQGKSSQGYSSSQYPTGANQQPAALAATGNLQGATSSKKPRSRRPGQEYTVAARQRRLQQESNNYYHPPSKEDVWICEFCEYEAIFGCQPVALIRQYEIKDRRERRRLAEKRRLLEKAKLRGKKSKKGGKATTKNSGTSGPSQQQQQGQSYEQPSATQVSMQNEGTQSDEYFADEYENEGLVASPPLENYPLQAQQPSSPFKATAAGTNVHAKGAGSNADHVAHHKVKPGPS